VPRRSPRLAAHAQFACRSALRHDAQFSRRPL
jgi:hypothetical protein